MKVKIFKDESYYSLQKEINEWLNNKKLKIFNITQSTENNFYRGNYSGETKCFTVISIFYEESE